MNKKRYEQLANINVEAMAREFASTFRNDRAVGDYPKCIRCSAFVLLRIKQNKAIKYDSLEDFIKTSEEPSSRCARIRDALQGHWDEIIRMRNMYSEDELEAFLLRWDPFIKGSSTGEDTPGDVAKLAVKMGDIHPGDQVGDFCTGSGRFICEAAISQPNAKYYGVDLSDENLEILRLRAQMLDIDIETVHDDVLNMRDKDRKFDLIFANCPWGMRPRDISRNGKDVYDIFSKDGSEYTRLMFMDWMFNKTVCDSLKDSGRAICTMTVGSLQNTSDSEVRRRFSEAGFVEAVILLPDNIYQSTLAGTVMIVFSHGNRSIMMVDARNMCAKGRRYNTITDDNIDEIMSALTTEGRYSKRVTYDELAENDYVLNPARYTAEKIEIACGVPFKSIIKDITRGTPLGADALDELSTQEDTGIEYLMLVNIQDGIIDDELTHLKSIDKRQERYSIKNNSLIISKNGRPYKIAVAEVAEGHQMIASGNLYVIELDESKADPYYIKAFLESDKGAAVLENITVGATMPNIGVDQLRRITVPCPPIEEQRAVADRYRALIAKVKGLRRDINESISSMKTLYSESEI